MPLTIYDYKEALMSMHPSAIYSAESFCIRKLFLVFSLMSSDRPTDFSGDLGTIHLKIPLQNTYRATKVVSESTAGYVFMTRLLFFMNFSSEQVLRKRKVCNFNLDYDVH